MKLEQILDEIKYLNDNCQKLTVHISSEGSYAHSLTNVQLMELDENGEGFEHLNVKVVMDDFDEILGYMEDHKMNITYK